MKEQILAFYLTMILVSDKPCVWTHRRMMERTVVEWPTPELIVEEE